MANGHPTTEHPTMIIPKGTEIRVGSSGQLSIKTPGNLVIQNSGNYAEIESVTGSIRIEENVTVEAVNIKAAEACYVLGSLTAWRVEAKKLTLDDKARAFIMLQEAQDLELAKSARLVGNFSSEKEVFLMMSRYAPQLKSLPMQIGPGESAVPPAPHPPQPPPQRAIATHAEAAPSQTPFLSGAASATAPIPGLMAEAGAGDGLRIALILLERDLRRPSYDGSSRAALTRLHSAVRDGDLARLRSTVDDDFSAIADPSDDARRARDMIISFLRSQG